jgi:HAD superfamily hydrolase (TIGR01484 family)
MRYLALATDYDGTLAHHGRVSDETLSGLEKFLASGRKLILVTGRELDDLQKVFDHFHLFETIVAENGALLYRPGSREEKVLGQRPPDKFIETLKQRGVGPISTGRVIVATWEPHETTVLETIRDLGLELQVIFNKGAVMVLPTGINKAFGMATALDEMGLSSHNLVCVGDAENDHAFLGLCECGVAVANALPLLKEKADFVTAADHGAGVRELIDELVETDLAGREGLLSRHHILVGTREDGSEFCIPSYGQNILIAGSSGSGKSTLTGGILERLAERNYQFCIIDPEGDYETFEKAVPLENPQRPPSVDEVLELLKKPQPSAVVNLVGLPISDRPGFFLALLPRLQELRARTGRPHWLVLDEAHHLLPAAWESAVLALPQVLRQVILITVHPNQVSPKVLAAVGAAVIVGHAPEEALRQLCDALGQRPPREEGIHLEPGQALVWPRSTGLSPFRIQVAPSRTEHHRHSRKYAEGTLPPERSFNFRGPDGKLNLRAQNLILFLQLAEGVDDDTWLYHLRRGEYSRWFRDTIKDDRLAAEAALVEGLPRVSAAESRARIKSAIEKHYTLPSATPFPLPGTDAAEVRK